MAKTREEKEREQETEAAALVASAAGALTADGGSDDAELRELRRKFLGLANSILEGQEKKKEEDRVRAQRRNENSVREAKKREEERNREQATCSHLKLDNVQRRTVGQFLTSGQLRTSCLYCQKEWFNPPNPALHQEACPPQLLPNGNEVGGAVTMVPTARFDQVTTP